MAELSKHSVKRIRQRLGINKKAAERALWQAMAGIKASEISGSLKRFLVAQSIANRADYRVTPMGIFAFSHSDGTLITVLPVPPKYRSTIMTIWSKRNS